MGTFKAREIRALKFPIAPSLPRWALKLTVSEDECRMGTIPRAHSRLWANAILS